MPNPVEIKRQFSLSICHARALPQSLERGFAGKEVGDRRLLSTCQGYFWKAEKCSTISVRHASASSSVRHVCRAALRAGASPGPPHGTSWSGERCAVIRPGGGLGLVALTCCFSSLSTLFPLESWDLVLLGPNSPNSPLTHKGPHEVITNPPGKRPEK